MIKRAWCIIGSVLATTGVFLGSLELYAAYANNAPLSLSAFRLIADVWASISLSSFGAVEHALHVNADSYVAAMLKMALLVPVSAVFAIFGISILLLSRKQPTSRNVKQSRTIKPQDREFLPAALELIETPASPIAVGLLWFVCLFFLTALAWSYFGKLDIYAIASGKIQASGGSKVVQPLSAGKVVSVFVDNGKHVVAGDVLIELDPTETAADRQAQSRELETEKAEIARRQTAIGVARIGNSEIPAIPFDSDISDDIRRRETMVLAADLAELNAMRDSLRTQLRELDARHNKLEATLKARTKLLAVLQERVDTRNALDAQGQGYRAKVIDALQQFEQENTNFATDQGELAEIEANKASVEKRIVETTEKFISEQASKFAEAQEKKDRLSQELIKATIKEKETRLIAPISGVVQQLSVTTLGQVVAAGQSLMTIVPEAAPIEVEALIQNQDIGFVSVGQPVTIKVDAFPFTRYGTIEGTIVTVSRDGVDQRTAANLSDAPSITKPQGPAAPSSTTTAQTLAFPSKIAVTKSTIDVDGRPIQLLPGMAVTAEIKTGQRRAIDYVLSPLREVADASLRER